MDSIKIGRSNTNDLILNDNSVSRQHAIVTLHHDGSATIRDLNSTQGTFVDGKRITDETAITSLSKIRLANTEITLAQIRNSCRPAPTKIVNTEGIRDIRRVGRSHDNDIVQPAGDISSHHCIIGRDSQDNPVIVDVGSSNGTFVNDRRITSLTVLRRGDSVRLGKTTIFPWETYIAPVSPVKPDVRSDVNRKKIPLITGGVAAVLLVILIGVFLWRLRPMSPEAIYSKYASSVVLIYTNASYEVKFHGKAPSSYDSDLKVFDNVYLDEDGKLNSGTFGSFGTGFFISDDGKIMTNRHVVMPVGEDAVKDPEKIKGIIENTLYMIARQTGEPAYAALANDIEVKYENEYIGIARNDTYVNGLDDFQKSFLYKTSNDDELDVAIVQLNTKRTPDDAVVVDMKDISRPDHHKIGNKVFTIGFPQALVIGSTKVGLEANNQSGEITQERGEYTYGHNISIHQGASGSPVFDNYGKFAGIIVSGFLGVSQGFNHAVNPDKAAQFAN